MKSDREKLVELLSSFGVEITEINEKRIDLMEGDLNINGYCGFYTSFWFDDDGSFKSVGAWE